MRHKQENKKKCNYNINNNKFNKKNMTKTNTINQNKK